MTKKILIILTVLIITFTLATPAFATDSSVVTFNDDFTKLYFNDYTYSRQRSDRIFISAYDNYEYYDSYCGTGNVFSSTYSIDSYEEKYHILLTPEQHKSVADVEIYNVLHEIYFEISVSYMDGSILTVSFMRDDYIKTYNDMCDESFAGEMFADINYMYDEPTKFTVDELQLSEKTTVRTGLIDDYFDVVSISADGKLFVNRGVLIYYNEEFYFVDLSSEEYKNKQYFYVYDEESITIRKIQNKELCTLFEEQIFDYYDYGNNYIYNDKFLESITKFILVVLFVVLPLILFVLSIVLLIKAKNKSYKKFSVAISVFSILEIILFIITGYNLFK